MNNIQKIEKFREILLSDDIVEQTTKLSEQQQDKWQEHNSLERGNCIKVFNETLI